MVGFTVMVSDHDDRRNIRSICPLIDTIDCRDAEFDVSAVTARTAVIGGGPVQQGSPTDYFSSYYGKADGTFCGFEYRYDRLPAWAFAANGTLTIQSLTPVDEPDSMRARLRIYYGNQN